MNKDTLAKMYQLKLYGMHQTFKMVVEHPSSPSLSADQLIAQLVDAEFDDRHNRKIARLLKNAKLRYKAAIEDIIYEPQRNLDKDSLIRLAQLKLSKAEGTYFRMMRKLQRQKVIILDDFGLQTIDSHKSHILLELIEDRYNLASLIITSQVPVDKWYELISEKTIVGPYGSTRLQGSQNRIGRRIFKKKKSENII